MSKDKFSCSLCSKTWQKTGATNCWSKDPSQGPPKPAYCPSGEHAQLIEEAFNLYKGDSEDARIADVATRVEGLCYESEPGSDVINARWTRVEDTIAFAKLMGYRKSA